MSAPLRLRRGDVGAEIIPLGAAIHQLAIRRRGRWKNLLLSRENTDSVDMSRFGATIGRVAGRIGGGRVVIDGVSYELDRNEPPNHLHGGSGGFDCRYWEVVSAAPDRAVLRLVSQSGDQGYPGRLEALATYSLIEGGAQVEYEATADAPTIVTLTAHPYFNLGAPLADHRVTIPAGRHCLTRHDDIPTGEIAPVAGTPLDFRGGPKLGAALARATAAGVARRGGLNHDFVVDGSGLRDHMILESPAGIRVTVRSDAPVLHVYSGEHIDRRGIAVEPQGYPDAQNHPHFPSVELRPGQTCRSTVQWLVDAD
jgi:aldose 1-epimerase